MLFLLDRTLDEQPVLAAEAVKRVDANVDNDDAVLLLGHPLKIKAERKRKIYQLKGLSV